MKENEKRLSLDRAKELLSYDRETGLFTWRVDKGNGTARAGKTAGWSDEKGYLRIEIDGSAYKAHRLAVFLVEGEWPIAQVDHRNNDRADNSYLNLRHASNQQNAYNKQANRKNTSGHKGVCFEPSSGKWRVRVCVGTKRISVGRFASLEDASTAYDRAAALHHGEFFYKNEA